MAVTDLTNTTWQFNDTIPYQEERYSHFYVNFVSNGNTYDDLYFQESGGYSSISYFADNDYVLAYDSQRSGSNKWLGENYKTITISDGQDVTNSVLCSLMEENATQIFNVTVSSVGNGSASFTRGVDPNTITVTSLPNFRNHFTKYEVTYNALTSVELKTEDDNILSTQSNETLLAETYGSVTVTDVYTSTPITLTIGGDISVIAYFEEDSMIHLDVSTSFVYGSVFVSDNDQYESFTTTLWARPFPDYTFVRWSDGVTSNPRTLTVNESMTLTAIYQRDTDNNGIYQYRCYVKDQMYLTDPPKAFMVVNTFSVRTDYLTKATSTIDVMDIASDVNEGDVLVLYDPRGTTLYQGVIKSIEDTTITCSQMQSFYKGKWIYNTHSSATLEQEIAWLLTQYKNGYIYKSSYRDLWVSQRLNGITVQYTGSTSVHLPTDLDEDGNEQMTTRDMEDFIYELYQKYQIEFDFEINFSGANYVRIRVPNYAPMAVGNNMFAIQNMLPVTTIEETNRLIIFAQDKTTYRTTYVATKNGIVEAPTSLTNRFNLTNTQIVSSDDPVEDLVANNLPNTMYNHKIQFTLVIKNFLYEFGDFHLGGQLNIYYNTDYYNSVLTGYEIKKTANANITSVDFTCGLVRTKLTQLLTLGKV